MLGMADVRKYTVSCEISSVRVCQLGCEEEQSPKRCRVKDMDGDSSDDQLTHHSNDSSDDTPSSSK